MVPDNLEKKFISANGVTLHVVQAGPEDGDPVILLHGFPEFWYTWRHQIAHLSEQGYRVIVPDQRGYNLSDKPAGVENYDIQILAQDVIALAQALGHETFYLVGHDWGAAVAWVVAQIYPDQVRKLSILNVPHPKVMQDNITGNPLQMLKSWYIGFFQIPWLPETLISFDDYNLFAQGLRGNANPGAFTDADLEEFKLAWGQPNAMKSMLNWYRAVARSGQLGKSASAMQARITMPTLILWGENDLALRKEMAHQSAEQCDDVRVVMFPDATHWLQNDKPEEISRLLAEFFAGESVTATAEAE